MQFCIELVNGDGTDIANGDKVQSAVFFRTSIVLSTLDSRYIIFLSRYCICFAFKFEGIILFCNSITILFCPES